MIGMSVKVSGTRKLEMKLMQFRVEIPEAVEVALYWLAERIMDFSQMLVPVDTGDLKESAFISKPSGGLFCMGYGAPHAPYVHEDTSASHEQGEAKFLEKAILKEARGALHLVIKRAERAILRRETWTAGKYPAHPRGGV